MNNSQEIYEYKKTRQDGGNPQHKPCKQFSTPTLHRMEGNFYLIGPKVYRLNKKKPGEIHVPYAELMTDEEVLQLPITIKYSGPPVEFNCDEIGFIECYGKILNDFNIMQEDRFFSFPLGMYVKQAGICRLVSCMHE